MSFRVAIPSFKRAEMLGQKTLRFLAEQKIPKELIDVFVADKEEEEIYKNTLDKNLYDKIIVGIRGIARQRVYIQNYYAEGQKVFSIDDDIRGIATLKMNFDLKDFIERMFELCEKEKVTMWGVYPASSMLYLKDEIRKGVFYIVGCFYGFINQKNLAYPNLDGKEDMWASLERSRMDGAVLRCTWVSPKTTYWLKEGGLSAYGRTLETEKENSQIICDLFPQYCKGVYTKKNGHPDVKLKRLPYTIVSL
jgi:hypothetical protein